MNEVGVTQGPASVSLSSKWSNLIRYGNFRPVYPTLRVGDPVKTRESPLPNPIHRL